MKTTTCTATFLLTMLLLWIPSAWSATADVVISEFMASNKQGLFLDEDAEAQDWVELYNTHLTEAVDVGGLYLTDSRDAPRLWQLPPHTILGAHEYLVVFASGKDRKQAGAELHTNFTLRKKGEYLGLMDATGTPLYEYAPAYPAQSADRSYGIDPSTGALAFFATPTPHRENSVGESVATVVASIPRGFYITPFSVEVSTAANGARILYTLDGSKPTNTTGLLYEGSPIMITTTTVLRAAAFGAHVALSPTSTFSYIFLNDVIQQPKEIENFPVGMLRRVRSGDESLVVTLDMEMDPEIVADYASEILDGMMSIPSLVISASPDDFWGPDAFFNNIEDNEKEVSLEVLYPNKNAAANEQVNVGCEGHSKNFLKRSLRFNFRSEYGLREWETELLRDYDLLHGESVVNTFRTLVLKGGHNRAWTRVYSMSNTAFTIDQFYRDSQIAMSGYGVHGVFVHLYLNGVYWGLYNLSERPDDQYGESYYGGNEDDYVFRNHNTERKDARWEYLLGTLVKKDMSVDRNYQEIKQYVDVESFADYFILNTYFGNVDWPGNNWYASYRDDSSPLGPTPARWYAWDGDMSSFVEEGKPSHLNRGLYPPGAKTVKEIQKRLFSFFFAHLDDDFAKILFSLRNNASFRDLLEERADIHVAGALSADAAVARWNTLANGVRSAVIGESARWGDALKEMEWYDPSFLTTRTRNGDWQHFVDFVPTILNGNEERLLSVLRDNGMYGENKRPADVFANKEWTWYLLPGNLFVLLGESISPYF